MTDPKLAPKDALGRFTHIPLMRMLNDGKVQHLSFWKRMRRTTGMKQCGRGKIYKLSFKYAWTQHVLGDSLRVVHRY
ncbi:hypothetical protein OAN307_c03510 [Octadecabacter antarcticus 307]|uniref:Uncharacterized protein n=1 Tax=Octadecabacter antarcticus 307 TaxID=391626 RepID=M9R0F6_9RHOB|nr:hypothetical protein OAN307_c03510 [Octadecabacter antarcticus 307]